MSDVKVLSLGTRLQDRIAGDEAALTFGDEVGTALEKAFENGASYGNIISVLHGYSFIATREMVAQAEDEIDP